MTATISEDPLVQQTFSDHLHNVLGWETVYAFNAETFGPKGTLGRTSERLIVLERDLRAGRPFPVGQRRTAGQRPARQKNPTSS